MSDPQFFDCDPIEVEIEILGHMLSNVINCGPIEVELEIAGSKSFGFTIDCLPIEVEVTLHSYGTLVGVAKCNWVAWSKIGKLDFTIDESNVAGERPLDWKGCVYDILKLDKSVVVYGANGVSVLAPDKISYVDPSIHWGLQTIHRIGILNKGAVAGNDKEHYFIDLKNRLFKLSGQGLQLLDYSEYLEHLDHPVLSLDPESGLLYICDNDHGFVYSTMFGSMGEGPINVTGIGSQNGTLYVATIANAEAFPRFHICTDIYDLGTRKLKTVQRLCVGTNLRVGLEAMIEYRILNRQHFDHTPWVPVSPEGIATLPCYGTEFKFQLRSYIYEYFELDYVQVEGIIHGYTYLDQIA